MFHNHTIKILGTFTLLMAFTGQMAAAAKNGINSPVQNVSNNATIPQDIVLIIDTSSSMAYETRPDLDPNDNQDGSNLFRYDPYIAGMVSENPEDCNQPSTSNPCEPMKSVKDAALSFIQTLNFDYDRVGIVALTGQETDGTAKRHPVQVLPLSSSKVAVQNAITNLKVFQPHRCDNTLTASSPEFNSPNDPGVCILFVNGEFATVIPQSMQLQFPTGYYNYAPHPSSNIGGTLRIAGSILSGPDQRQDANWVTILLSTNGATSTDTPGNYPDTLYADGVPAAFPYGYCPESTYKPSNGSTGQFYPYKFCTDGRPSVRHTFSQTASFTYNGVTNIISVYDPDDYARDRADQLATLRSNPGVTIYTIGLGQNVIDTASVASGEPALAESLLQYIANAAGGGNVTHGNYYYASNITALESAFHSIANNLGSIAPDTNTPTVTATPTLTTTPTTTVTQTSTRTPTATATTYRVNNNTFADVPIDYWAWKYIESIYNAGITDGCGVSPLLFCPTNEVTRAQMAVFLLKGIHGSSYNPPQVTDGDTGFKDVAANYWAAAWIKQLAREGISSGCGNGNFCPNAPVTRDQMSIFLLKAKHGPLYTPPAIIGSSGFVDVPATYWAAAWIKQLVTEGISSGCSNGNYCPENTVTRDQMAVFLQKTFNLPLPNVTTISLSQTFTVTTTSTSTPTSTGPTSSKTLTITPTPFNPNG